MGNRMEISKKSLLKMFATKKVMTLSEAARISRRTKHSTKYHLKKFGAVTSINKNAGYYSLPEIIEWDEYGLWEYEKILFSKLGTVAATITFLVDDSPSGLSGGEIARTLKCSCYSILVRLTEKRVLRRERMSGRYIYFSADDELFKRQREKHLELSGADAGCRELAHILSLAERIGDPSLSVPDIAGKLRRRNIPVTNKFIGDFFTLNNIVDGSSDFSTVALLRNELDKTRRCLSSGFLFRGKPTVLFDAAANVRRCCGKKLKQYKTRSKNVHTMHIGGFTAREKILKCLVCGRIYHSAELLEIIPPGCVYGYDVMIHIGDSTFFGHLQATEIQADLRERNIPVSVSEVEYLAKKFIVYLSIVHERNNAGIVEMMDANGGYILHIDALGDKGRRRLISGVDGISDFVLGNAKIKSERCDYVAPFLRKIKNQFGTPMAVVQDMGRGVMKAVEEVFPSAKILICHFHFLRDIGKDLLEDDYDVIRKRLRHFGFLVKLRNFSKELKLLFDDCPEAMDEFHEAGINGGEINPSDETGTAIYLYTLIEWILDWKKESGGYGFPFDRPHFDLASRVESVFKIIDDMEENGDETTISVVKTRRCLKPVLEEITLDAELKNAMSAMKNDIKVFDGLRNAMRIAPKNGLDGLNEDGKGDDIKTIEASVDKFRGDLEADPKFAEEKKSAAFLKQMDKYRSQLFADPITVRTPGGTKTIQPQRTNNLMERMFRDFTRDNKRKTGSDSAGRTIQAMINDTPLIRNLKNDNYRKIIIGDKKSLAEVFSEVDVSEVRKKMKEQNVCDEKIPEKIQNLLKKANLPDILASIGAKFKKSN